MTADPRTADPKTANLTAGKTRTTGTPKNPDYKKIKQPSAARQKKDLQKTDQPRGKRPQKDRPEKGLPETTSSEKVTSAATLSLSKRGRRRHRRQVFKPKRRGRPRHMLPGGSR